VTAEHLRALADQLDQEALAEARAGRIQRAVLKGMDAEKYRKTAAEMERVSRGEPLPEVGRSDNVRSVNNLEAQRARRGRAVALAKADSALKRAVTGDPLKRWRSMTEYAKRLGISKASLSEYESGERPCPARVDRLIRKDFPALRWQWPRGVVD
jgi:transcriptional regulator with XRE-family HTH domain